MTEPQCVACLACAWFKEIFDGDEDRLQECPTCGNDVELMPVQEKARREDLIERAHSVLTVVWTAARAQGQSPPRPTRGDAKSYIVTLAQQENLFFLYPELSQR